MSAYSGSSRSSVASKRVSAGNIVSPPPAPVAVASSSAHGQENVRPRNANTPREGAGSWRHDRNNGHGHARTPQHQHHQPMRALSRASTQKESVMTRNRHVRAPVAVETEDAVTVHVSLVGAKFQCLVEKEWPCESLIASAMAEYHLAFPMCEVPDCSTIFHVGRKETLEPKDPVGKWCSDGDEIELGMRDRSLPVSTDTPPVDDGLQFHTYDFTIVFHRLPLGFTLKQEMDATVVANIYPKSIATHYERLVPGTIVVQIGDTPLEELGLRQVHEVIRHCKLPLPIRFRGWKKPVARRSSFSAASDNVASPRLTPAPASDPHNASRRRKSAPSGPSVELKDTATRARASTETAAASESSLNSSSESTAQNHPAPSPYSQTKQKITSERKKTNSSSPYPDRPMRTNKSGKNSPVEELNVPLVDQLDTRSNQGKSPDSSPTSVADLKLKQKEFHLHGAALNLNSVTEQLAATSIGEPSHEERMRRCEVDSNQNEEESEEMLVEHIKILQAELVKKHEEAKLLAMQLEKCHAQLNAVRHKREKQDKRQTTGTTERPSSTHRASAPSLTLTPEVLEAIEAKQGLPQSKGRYAGSNASSVSGYSSYSNRSAMKRHSQQLSRFVGKTGESSNRCDASVASCNSTQRRERSGSISDGLKSPRHQAAQNVTNRYNFMPPRYSTQKDYEAPSSFSTKGGLISRAKITRDSYIKIPDTPGVGAYDVKMPQERVRGGEIGDSDRHLPWP